jgi:hypothetical protein
MAVYRSDQAQFTFGVEAAQGGDPEMIEGTLVSSSPFNGELSAVHNAGSRTITITRDAGTAVVGDFIRIGTTAGTPVSEAEIRRIEAMSDAGDNGTNTFTLDRPLAFYHPDDDDVDEVSAVGGNATRNDKNKYITWIPGVYETIDTPDPQMSIEGRRFLSTQSKRNWSVAYAGAQALAGGVSGITLLNGWPLRFPIGKVTTIPSAVTGSAALSSMIQPQILLILLKLPKFVRLILFRLRTLLN